MSFLSAAKIDVETLVNGEAVFTNPGTFTYTIPDDVGSISAVVIGGGGGGMFAPSNGAGTAGAGGGLAFNNNIEVSPGEQLTVTVGDAGSAGIQSSSTSPTNGGRSEIERSGQVLLFANGGEVNTTTNEISTRSNGGTAGGISGTQSFTGGGGGPSETEINGERGGGFGAFGADTLSGGGGGGGGAAGYGDSNASVAQAGDTPTTSRNAGGGGGTNIFGSSVAGEDGEDARNDSNPRGGNGGDFGGVACSADDSEDGGTGGSGAVRIIFGVGDNRVFPDTNVDQGSSNGNIQNF